jgi:hypothetical protein
VVAVAVAAGAVLIDAHLSARTSQLRADAHEQAQALAHQLRTTEQLRSDVRRLRASSTVLRAANRQLRVQNGRLRATAQGVAEQLRNATTTLARVRKAKVRTIIRTNSVIKKVPVWVPSGFGIDVETTGYDGEISISDVQLTETLGFTSFVGIAQNLTHRTIPYAEIGCTFVDRDGAVLANDFANTTAWPAGATWGFTCSAPIVGATGGVVRVDRLG